MECGILVGKGVPQELGERVPSEGVSQGVANAAVCSFTLACSGFDQ
jgi:hypothetical protein